jgi:pimeloyl-ACP methyl ester carboxylesterase
MVERVVDWALLSTDLSLPFVEQGDAGGRPIVLVPGYAESWRSFELVLTHLPPAVRAFAVTLRGHGGPRTMASTYSLEEFAGDVADFMDSLGLSTGVVAGSSSGGYVAQQLAKSYPEKVTGLVLIGSPRTLRDVPEVGAFAERLEQSPDRLDRGFVREFAAGMLVRPVPDGFLETMAEEGAAIPTDVWRAMLGALRDAAPPTDSCRLKVPTLILWGDRDAVVSRAEAEALRDAIDGSKLVRYEETGHVPAWEHPERVAADITRLALSLHV